MATFFTSDTHFGHGRIIRYCSRPFDSSESMDSEIIRRCNEVVGPGDVLYHLGDIAWSSFKVKPNYLDHLRCKNVHLIIGNHDPRTRDEYLAIGFNSVSDYKEIRLDIVRGSPNLQGSSRKVVLCHYPMRSWHGKGSGGFQLYGHCHGTLEPGIDRSMDVGVDTHDFYPWSWDDVKVELLARPIFSPGTSKEFTTGVGDTHPNPVEGFV